MTGFSKPLLFLPNECYSDTDLNFILRHELTHYKRRDLWYKLFLIIVNAIHWFNPFIYLLFREASAGLELSCDDKVINGLSNDERRTYSETILASITGQKSLKTVLSTYFFGGQKTMKSRFANIFNTKKKRNGAIALLTVMLTVGILGGLIACNVDISENKLLTKLGYTKTLLTDLLDNRTTFSQDNEHINQIVKSLPLQDDSEYKSFSLEDGQKKEINLAYEFDGGRNALDPFPETVRESNALLLFATVEGLEKVNFLHYANQTLYNTDSYTIDDLAARFGNIKPLDLGFSDLYNALTTNIQLPELYFGYPFRIFLGYSFENVSDRYGEPDEIWQQPDGSTVLIYTEHSVLSREFPSIDLANNDSGYTAMYYFDNSTAETNDNLTGLYATRFVRGTTYGKTYGDITEELGLPSTIKVMGGGDKYIAYPLREGQQRNAYFILHNDKVIEEGVMYGNDYTILDFEQKTSESDATNF